jgi:predicted Zn-dependent protease
MPAALATLYSILLGIMVYIASNLSHQGPSSVFPLSPFKLDKLTLSEKKNVIPSDEDPTQKSLATEELKTPTLSPKASTSQKLPQSQTTSDYESTAILKRPSSFVPCASPISFSIGTFDTRFGISKSEFSHIAENAGSLWSDAYGKKLFINKPQGGNLTINLIYDQRQGSTQEIGYLQPEIENTKKAAEAIKEAYNHDKESYTNLSASYTTDVTIYNDKFKEYDTKVIKLNTEGGASKEVYDAMMQQKDLLKKESDALESRRLSLIALTNSINDQIKKYNEYIAYVNMLIKKNNSLSLKKFTEGRYSTQNNTIDIYQFSDTTKLLRVLTHEFGHALTVDHNKNPDSIMYATNSGTTTILSAEDIRDLISACDK